MTGDRQRGADNGEGADVDIGARLRGRAAGRRNGEPYREEKSQQGKVCSKTHQSYLVE